MTLVRTLLLASALALPVTTVSIISASSPADAASMRMKHHHHKAKKVHRVKAKSCGTYMYWKAGKCMDARLKK